MPKASDQILTVAQMTAAEQALIAGGETVDTLMQTAGRGAAEWVWRIAAGRTVTVLCGPGNNGGDGYVIAQTLHERGVEVQVLAPYPPGTDAARNARAAFAGQIVDAGTRPEGEVFVDCLFGSGLGRPLESAACDTLVALASGHRFRIAVDMPSGIASDSGLLLNGGLPAYHLTLALGAWKYAHWLMPSSPMMGERHLVPIGVAAVEGAASLVNKPRLAAPDVDAHKYSRGLVAVAGGVMPGAALLAGEAAMRGGAGYVKLLADSPPAHRPIDLVANDQPLEIALEDPRISALLIGPGLGRQNASRERLLTALARDCPTVLDADALVLLRPEMLAGRKAPVIATPHEGELEKLCAFFSVDAESKLSAARDLARASGMAIVAKGPDTIIAAPDGRLSLARPATSWLSIAGTGDVLAGLLVSRLASGRDAFAAASEAVWLHGEAARLVRPPFTASDLAGHISAAIANCL
ncbi:NAD(P)H-hydrate dehydratase [Tsuneonella sp. CC-YZS046]|uniref:NAD(P)H-hydrate dehydratase n=1 Tax=Tsuneonella sp. CC-YZS046 TaxID=3042152 RepID=UPI002D798E3D|nr:NAD(P)H-hydrate dehydratase [Tsuneonella sp. CC-YZS046]WRO67870.1 NAD(P)H-hydrate dehydratase [Tsuneonella sp. CC-YZS046]